MSENNKCVYLHKDKDGVVRYVGSGTLDRANRTNGKTGRGNKYTEYVETNGRLSVEIVAEDFTKLEAENLERKLFDEYKDTILNSRRPSSVRPISKEMFDEVLYYDESSKSCLRWKVDRVGGLGTVKKKANSEAGSLNKGDGYYQIGLQGVGYKAHRIIALLHGFEINGKVIDHIDRNRTNNKISNLRVVTQKENSQNRSQQKLSSVNKSGVQGVSYDKQKDRWVASWYESSKQNLKCFYVKNYTSSEEAFIAAVEYRQKMIKLHYNL